MSRSYNEDQFSLKKLGHRSWNNLSKCLVSHCLSTDWTMLNSWRHQLHDLQTLLSILQNWFLLSRYFCRVSSIASVAASWLVVWSLAIPSLMPFCFLHSSLTFRDLSVHSAGEPYKDGHARPNERIRRIGLRHVLAWTNQSVRGKTEKLNASSCFQWDSSSTASPTESTPMGLSRMTTRFLLATFATPRFLGPINPMKQRSMQWDGCPSTIL